MTAAIDATHQALRDALAADRDTPDDYLRLVMLLHGAGRLHDAESTLRAGLARFPDTPSIHENLGVVLLALGDPTGAIAASEAALDAGSDSPNVWDCLADSFSRLGDFERSVTAGRMALEAKVRLFVGRFAGTVLEPGDPPPFDPSRPEENAIAFCLWGNAPRYLVPLRENVRLMPHLFPSWHMRVYVGSDVEPSFVGWLRENNVDCREMHLEPGVPPSRRLLWRFETMSDRSLRRFLIRDADSLLNIKERVAVDAWLQSRYRFHAMRDWYTHTDLILAGMWGGVGGVLPPLDVLMRDYSGWRMENDHVDQDVLSEAVWPRVRHDILIHDSVFPGCLGSVPFPPFGALPPGSHIGQNAFVHFEQAEPR